MTGSSLTAVPVALGAVCITKSAAGSGGVGAARAAAYAAVPVWSLQVLSCRDRDRAGLGRRDIRLADVPHQHPAARHLVGPNLGQRRLFDLAPVDGERTSRVEQAPRRRVGEVWRQPLDADYPVLACLAPAGRAP